MEKDKTHNVNIMYLHCIYKVNKERGSEMPKVVKSPKVPKNYRFSQNTLDQLEELQVASDKTATDLIEAAINYVYEEYTRTISGEKHDQFLISQVLGKRIKKVG